MSNLIVEVCNVDVILPHPNADNLELAVIKGWQTVIQKGSYAVGDEVVFVPVDAMLPDEISEALGVKQYLSKGCRVRAARLRGEISYGFVFKPIKFEDKLLGKRVGDDVAEELGITKYEAPPQGWEKILNSDCIPEHPMFSRYTNIQNIRNYPNIIQEGERICVSEKAHGANARYALVRDVDGTETFIAGSHRTQRKESDTCVYWRAMSDEIKRLLEYLMSFHMANGSPTIITLYGEIFGPGIQDLTYGLELPTLMAFDVSVNGAYLAFDEYVKVLNKFRIPRVPVLYDGPFSNDVLDEFTQGNTVIGNNNKQLREGIVIRPAVERSHHKIMRVVLKSINPDYLLRKGGTESH